jgi:bifunctional NMN adenylyltransferase/nudix hydrolase
MSDNKKREIGVVVGRFQIPELHAGHIGVLDEVAETHNKVIVFLGICPGLGDKRNPLDYDLRKKMIQEKYPEIIVLPISDQEFDKPWSALLDKKIREVCPVGDVTLYGSRDSFMLRYHGVFPTVELEQKIYISGTQVRAEAALRANGSVDFRRGVIYGSFNRYPTAYGTTDMAVINYKTHEVLMGRKYEGAKLRFPGGFLQPGETHEQGARREFNEETGGNVEVSKSLTYIGSFAIDDWRYRSRQDKITTVFFTGVYLWGPIEATDDLYEVEWVKIDKLREAGLTNHFCAEHVPLCNALVEHIDKNMPKERIRQSPKKVKTTSKKEVKA